MPAVVSLSKSNSWPSSNLFSVPVDLQSVRPVEKWASSGSDQLSVHLQLPPTSFTSQAPPRCVDISDHQSTRQLANLFNASSPIKRPISPVQSNEIHSLWSSRKLAGPLKMTRSVEGQSFRQINR